MKFDFLEKMRFLRQNCHPENFEMDLAQICKECGYTLLKDEKPVREESDEEYLTEIEALLEKQTFYLDQIDMKLDKLLNK